MKLAGQDVCNVASTCRQNDFRFHLNNQWVLFGLYQLYTLKDEERGHGWE